MSKHTTYMPNDREAVILAVLLHGERFGLEIRDGYERRAKKSLPIGSLYVTLERMEDKGLVKSSMGEATENRAGNRRKYYKVTSDGIRALNLLHDAIRFDALGVSHA